MSLIVATTNACGPTTYDTSVATTSVPTSSPAASVPTGTLEELLSSLSSVMDSLSTFIGPDQSGRTKAGKVEQLALIESLWSAARAPLGSSDPKAAESLERMVTLARTAVERNRPADADKAARFAGQVIDEFLATDR